jgi:hypothetical protein
MDDMARAAYVMSQAACAMAATAGMQAENAMRVAAGHRPVWGESDFAKIESEYMINHNAVVEYLRDGR